MGEREGRVFSDLVREAHFGLTHGIGRSGDLLACQPKAAGSTLLNKVSRYLALHALKIAGFKSLTEAVLFPLATGMSLQLSLLYLRSRRPDKNCRRVIWSRIDQGSCIKSILAADCEPIVIEPKKVGDGAYETQAVDCETYLKENSDSIVAIVATTSCFAPRKPDRVDQLADLSRNYGVPLLINNAYGVSDAECVRLINRAAVKIGSVSMIIIQSTDKNFLVPVGGSLISSPQGNLVSEVAAFYPGRASSTPTIDFSATILEMGVDGYQQLLAERVSTYDYLKERLIEMELGHPEWIRVIRQCTSQTSIAVVILNPPCLSNTGEDPGEKCRAFTQIGSQLYYRHVSGVRVICGCGGLRHIKRYGGISLSNFGAHSNDKHEPYFTAAAAIGSTRGDIDLFLERLELVLGHAPRRCDITCAS